jgi:hypothetical protein
MVQSPSIKSDPLVSIIITNYNYESFLANAIDSALCQSYQAVEVIVVDDGSTDNSREVINCYGHRVFPIFKQNGGQASAMNAGFFQSHGDLVIFLDADDMLLSDTVQLVVDAYWEEPDVAKVMYPLEVIDAKGQQIGELRPYAHLPIHSGTLHKHVLTFPFDMVWMSTSGNSFAASVLKQILPIPETEYPLGADYYLSFITPLFGPVVFLQDIGAYYRIHGNNHHESLQRIDLGKIRRIITFSNTTQVYIQRFAAKLQLEGCPPLGRELISVSSISERLISLRLSPGDHPMSEDTVWRLFRLGVLASLRRFDVIGLMRFMFIIWFAALAIVPPQLVRGLAVQFFLPDRRPLINRLLRIMNRRL